MLDTVKMVGIPSERDWIPIINLSSLHHMSFNIRDHRTITNISSISFPFKNDKRTLLESIQGMYWNEYNDHTETYMVRTRHLKPFLNYTKSHFGNFAVIRGSRAETSSRWSFVESIDRIKNMQAQRFAMIDYLDGNKNVPSWSSMSLRYLTNTKFQYGCDRVEEGEDKAD